MFAVPALHVLDVSLGRNGMSVARGGVIGPHSRLRVRIRARTDAYCSRPGLDGDGVPPVMSLPPFSIARALICQTARCVIVCALVECGAHVPCHSPPPRATERKRHQNRDLSVACRESASFSFSFTFLP